MGESPFSGRRQLAGVENHHSGDSGKDGQRGQNQNQGEGVEVITIDEAAAELRLAPFTVRKYARLNIIPATKVGRSWMFDNAETLKVALQVKGGNKLQQARLRGRIQ